MLELIDIVQVFILGVNFQDARLVKVRSFESSS